MRYVIWNRRGHLMNTLSNPVASWTQDKKLICVSTRWEAWEKIPLPQIPVTSYLPPAQGPNSVWRCRGFLLSLFKPNEKIWTPSAAARTAPGQPQSEAVLLCRCPPWGTPHTRQFSLPSQEPKQLQDRVWPPPSSGCLTDPPQQSVSLKEWATAFQAHFTETTVPNSLLLWKPTL